MRNAFLRLMFSCIALLVVPSLSHAEIDEVTGFHALADSNILSGVIDFHCHASFVGPQLFMLSFLITQKRQITKPSVMWCRRLCYD